MKPVNERTTGKDVVEGGINGNMAVGKVNGERSSEHVKHDSPRKFHISNFTLSSDKAKTFKKKHKDRERKESGSKYEQSSSHTKRSTASPSKMISSLYGTQSLELKHSKIEANQARASTSDNRRLKPPIKLQQTVSRQKSVPSDRFCNVVKSDKINKDLMKEPYIPEYHHVRRYISTDIDSEFAELLHVEVHTNGSGLVLHSYQDEIDDLPANKQQEFVNEYMRLAFLEDENQTAYFTMAIVHDSARSMPDLIDYLADKHPQMTAKMGMLGKSDIATMMMSEVKEKIYNSYASGTFRAGPLLQLSLVGLAQEEVCLGVIKINENTLLHGFVDFLVGFAGTALLYKS